MIENSQFNGFLEGFENKNVFRIDQDQKNLDLKECRYQKCYH